MLCTLVTSNKLKLHDLSSTVLCCSDKFLKHGRTDTNAPTILKNRNGNGCSMGRLYAVSKTDLAVACNRIINTVSYTPLDVYKRQILHIGILNLIR